MKICITNIDWHTDTRTNLELPDLMVVDLDDQDPEAIEF